MSANSKLTHQPTTSDKCYSSDGYDGASHSNIYLGRVNTHAIDGYIVDPGDSNFAVGHRRWILHTQAKTMGHGATWSDPGRLGDSLYVFGTSGSVASDSQPAFIAWPSAGYFPKQFTNWGNIRWSFSKSLANFKDAVVTIKKGDVFITPTIVMRSGSGYSYGDNSIVWTMPSSVTYNDGDKYNVTVTVQGATHKYWVKIVDIP